VALNIKNVQVEELVTKVAEMTGETKTGAVLQALRERHARLRLRVADESRRDRVRRFLEREIWPRARSASEEPSPRGGGVPGDEPVSDIP
jgi:antitoxin VapB